MPDPAIVFYTVSYGNWMQLNGQRDDFPTKSMTKLRDRVAEPAAHEKG